MMLQQIRTYLQVVHPVLVLGAHFLTRPKALPSASMVVRGIASRFLPVRDQKL